MADELIHSRTCGENWWSHRTMFGSSSLCASSTISDVGEDFGWSNINLFEDMKHRSTDDTLFLHQDAQNLNDSLDSTTTSEWNEAFLQTNGSSSQSSYPIMLQEDYNLGITNYQHHHQQPSVMDFCPKTYVSDQESSNSTTFTSSALNQNYGLEQQQMSSDFTSTCDVLPSNYQLNSSSSCGYSSAFLQNLFADDHHSTNFPSSTSSIDNNFQTKNMNGFSPINQPLLAFSDNTSSWDSTAAALNDIKAALLPSPSSSVGEKYNRPKAYTAKARNEVAKKTKDEPSSKRPRIETPSPLPTFKVRKEKLGDRITALQQLVSPFGKTDTASVLHEAIEYIKFLHDQVNVFSTPYMNNGCPSQRQQGMKQQDLKSRGLCLVPLSSTFSLATEPPTEFCLPTLGGAFRNDKWEAWNGGSHIALACKF